MEVLFCLEPLFFALCLSGIISGAILFIVFIVVWISSFESNDTESISQLRMFAKRTGITAISLLVASILFQPLAQPMNIYKNILIYRGINSALADKTINTAEKALEVFNKKLDEQLKEKK